MDNPKPHLFQPGNPGRPKGSRNAISESFLSALYADFQANGAQAIADARAESPLGYVKMVAGLLPQKLEIGRTANDLTDEELMQIIEAGAVAARETASAILPNVDASGSA